MKKFFSKEVIISSIIFFILGCWYNNWEIFRIGNEYEKVTVTVDRYIDYSSEYLIDDFITKKNHYLDISNLIDYIIENNDEICVNEDKFIKINNIYYNICGDGIEIIPPYSNVIEEYEEYYDARINEKYYKKIK